jgi:uncharacterized C2H2 Zn-finger protein
LNWNVKHGYLFNRPTQKVKEAISDLQHMIKRADRMPSEEEEIVSFVPSQQSRRRVPKAHGHRGL